MPEGLIRKMLSGHAKVVWSVAVSPLVRTVSEYVRFLLPFFFYEAISEQMIQRFAYTLLVGIIPLVQLYDVVVGDG